MIDEIRYINQQYKQIHQESWSIVKSDFQRHYVDFEHIDIMDAAYMDYDELAYHVEVVMDRVEDAGVNNKEALQHYFINIQEASVAKGHAMLI